MGGEKIASVDGTGMSCHASQISYSRTGSGMRNLACARAVRLAALHWRGRDTKMWSQGFCQGDDLPFHSSAVRYRLPLLQYSTDGRTVQYTITLHAILQNPILLLLRRCRPQSHRLCYSSTFDPQCIHILYSKCNVVSMYPSLRWGIIHSPSKPRFLTPLPSRLLPRPPAASLTSPNQLPLQVPILICLYYRDLYKSGSQNWARDA